MSVSRQRALTLYRNILRAHREKLPYHLRELGDTYVREEFKRHKKADAKWLQSFFTEWDKYLIMIQQQTNLSSLSSVDAQSSSSTIGSDLPASTVQRMTDEQKQQLNQLRNEAQNLYRN